MHIIYIYIYSIGIYAHVFIYAAPGRHELEAELGAADRGGRLGAPLRAPSPKGNIYMYYIYIYIHTYVYV